MVFDRIREDIRAVFTKDPAARSTAEVLLCYPGIHALWFHRRAHWLWMHRVRFFARFVSHISRFLTGIEIHPGAVVGHRVVIDHGMGVVIGETAEVGDDVLIYMGVVLGGTALENVKRHPTVEENVVIGSGATILGPIRIGKGAKVGAGAVVVRSVPPGATVVGVPGRLAGPGGDTVMDPQNEGMPDPMLRVASRLLDRQNRLEERIRLMEQQLPGSGLVRSERVYKEQIRDALKEVIDPEVGIDIVDMGLIKDIIVNGTHVEIDMVLTSPACPMIAHLSEQVRRQVLGVCGIEEVEVKVLDEPWTWDHVINRQNSSKER
ncbi:MAG: serine O-acetyltransferase [Methanoregula sp.]|nr:serine O-acetyltransferase [Methanoregula sp.]